MVGEFPGLGPVVKSVHVWSQWKRPGPFAYLMGPGRPIQDLRRRRRCDTVPWPGLCRGCPDCWGIR